MAGEPLEVDLRTIGGSPFDRIVDNNGSLTLDATHTRGPGLAVKHEVGYGGNAYYGWGSSFSWAPIWYGRVYVWFDSLPAGSARLIRARGDRRLRFAIDLLQSGASALKDSQNRTIVTTSSSILTGGWVRIEWMVNQPAGSVTILLFNSPNHHVPTETLLSPDGVSIGPDTDQVQIGRSGSHAPRSSSGPTTRPSVRAGSWTGPLIRGAGSRRNACRDSALNGMKRYEAM